MFCFICCRIKSLKSSIKDSNACVRKTGYVSWNYYLYFLFFFLLYAAALDRHIANLWVIGIHCVNIFLVIFLKNGKCTFLFAAVLKALQFLLVIDSGTKSCEGIYLNATLRLFSVNSLDF